LISILGKRKRRNKKTKNKKTSKTTVPTPSIQSLPSISPAVLSFRNFQRVLLRSTSDITPLDKEKE